MKNIKVIFFVLLIGSVQLFAQYDIYKAYGRYEAEASAEDLGRMWTFDNIPLDKFENEYGFRPTEEWLEDVRMSALQFGRGCSGAFVSADGLIMTNHHCGRGQLPSLQTEGEDWLKDGHYAETLEDEVKVPNLFVDQLILIEDVTDEIYEAMEKVSTDDEKVAAKEAKFAEIV